MTPSPPTIDDATVLLWADTSGIAKTSACTFCDGDRIQTTFAGLAIAQYKDATECYLFLCDENWETQNDSLHRSVEEARAFAESLYPGISNRWQKPSV